ncbi:hypothetical protein HMPREF0083_03220 [Aneurinibacillus aneurinilyticus ATCC 12856]|uniref:DUF1904 domain-containing protein n=2 Tax=Aneurinibacillus aneurinilyticus TaxID=1391 RepID=U1X2E8_ANEAE|nr:hypothetical protein HMPREF0083_03220 [Aneurinibacillus aneurinilyticus ATCC 12856]
MYKFFADICMERKETMPFLRFKGFDRNLLKTISPTLIEEFSHIVNIPKDIVKIELLTVEQITNTPPSLEILMFQREQEKHDALAATLYSMLKEHGYTNVHIFFVILTPSLYYKEGQPLKEIPKIEVLSSSKS